MNTKKRLFNKWYDDKGKEFALNNVDSIDDKIARRKAKEIFSSVYDSVKNEFTNKIECIADSVFRELINCEDMLSTLKKTYDIYLDETKKCKDMLTVAIDEYEENKDTRKGKKFFKKKEKIAYKYFDLKNRLKLVQSFLGVTKECYKNISSLYD